MESPILPVCDRASILETGVSLQEEKSSLERFNKPDDRRESMPA